MNMAIKKGVLKEHLDAWLASKGDRQKRGALADMLSVLLKIHRKSVGRSMRRLQLRDSCTEEHRGRPRTYGNEVIAALSVVWEAMGHPCAEHLTPSALDTHVSFLRQDGSWHYGDDTTTLLLTMSESTKKRHVHTMREKRQMLRGRSATVFSPLKGMIPIRKSHTWQALPPGYVQTDSVVHSGDLLTGDLVYSVGIVDFRTYWSEYTAQWNKGQGATRESLETVRARTPFALCEIHPDTGNEFINYHVHAWATHEGLAMTRSEPNKKNDNMCIEERNNNIVRKHLGYHRFDAVSYVPLVSEILRIACLLHNHFMPVRRMTEKVRVGATWKRTFEKTALIPYERVLRDGTIPDTQKATLRTLHETLNPLHLRRELDRLKRELTEMLSVTNR
jgi:hypothetical protein